VANKHTSKVCLLFGWAVHRIIDIERHGVVDRFLVLVPPLNGRGNQASADHACCRPPTSHLAIKHEIAGLCIAGLDPVNQLR
jgi:hypothetical protein